MLSVFSLLKRRVRSTVEQVLATRGWELRRLPEHAPPGLEKSLRQLGSSLPRDQFVCAISTNRTVQALQQARTLRPGPTASPSVPSPDQAGLAIVELAHPSDRGWVPYSRLLVPAGRMVVRLPLHSLTTPGDGLRGFETELLREGWVLVDVIEYPTLGHPTDRTARVSLLAARDALSPSAEANYRLSEMRTWAGLSLSSAQPAQLIAAPRPGLGRVGVLNPGAIDLADATTLLCRVEQATWTELKRDEWAFMRQSSPLLLQLAADTGVRSERTLTLLGTPRSDQTRLEDFRLFRHRDQIYTNPAALHLPAPARPGRPVDLDRVTTRVGLASLDLNSATLRWLGEPSLPRQLSRTEKNWAFFSGGDALFVVHAPDPYSVYACDDPALLDFRPHVQGVWRSPEHASGLTLRNSINPVPYDDAHWLHIVHRVYPGKRYVFWALLISRKTLLPTFTIDLPLIRSGEGGTDRLLYLSAALVSPSHVHLFFGMDDCGTGSVSVSRAALDAAWRSAV
jgi:hypothetical protein